MDQENSSDDVYFSDSDQSRSAHIEDRDDASDDESFTYQKYIKFQKANASMYSILDDLFIKSTFRISRYNDLEDDLKEIINIVANRAFAKSGFDKFIAAIRDRAPQTIEFELEDYRTMSTEKSPKYRRLDGKKKLILSCALKRMRKKFIEFCEKKDIFHQTTDPKKHILHTEINFRFFKHYLDPKDVVPIKKEALQRKFQSKKKVDKMYAKEGDHNKIFSLVHKGGITKAWLDIVTKCPGWKKFARELIKIIKSNEFLEEYKLKIKSMIRSLDRNTKTAKESKAGELFNRKANNPKELLELVKSKMGVGADGMKLNEGKAPLSILEVEYVRKLVHEKLQSVLDEE